MHTILMKNFKYTLCSENFKYSVKNCNHCTRGNEVINENENLNENFQQKKKNYIN